MRAGHTILLEVVACSLSWTLLLISSSSPPLLLRLFPTNLQHCLELRTKLQGYIEFIAIYPCRDPTRGKTARNLWLLFLLLIALPFNPLPRVTDSLSGEIIARISLVTCTSTFSPLGVPFPSTGGTATVPNSRRAIASKHFLR